MITHEEALALIQEHTPEPHMLQHAEASGQVMRALAAHFGEPEDLWERIGLLHDVDYSATKDCPEKHGLEALDILAGKLPDEALYAIAAHNSECTGKEPASRLDYALRAAETVTGLIKAAALMRPTGMEGMEPKSLKKKMKDKAFAASVSRERIRECEKTGLNLDEFLTLAIKAMS